MEQFGVLLAARLPARDRHFVSVNFLNIIYLDHATHFVLKKALPMTDHNIRVLFCLLDGEDDFFQVKAMSSDSVLDLGEKIHRVKLAALEGVNANQIVLL